MARHAEQSSPELQLVKACLGGMGAPVLDCTALRAEARDYFPAASHWPTVGRLESCAMPLTYARLRRRNAATPTHAMPNSAVPGSGTGAIAMKGLFDGAAVANWPRSAPAAENSSIK